MENLATLEQNNESDTSNSTEEEISIWVISFDRLQLVFAIIGTILNLFTFLTLFWAPSVSKLMSILMKHQAFLDCLVCGMGTIILVQPFMWTVGIRAADIAICQLWHSQALYWGVFFLAGWNLVVLAVERVLAVCKPFVHANLTRAKMMLALIPVYIASVVCNLPAYFEARYTDGACESEYYFEGANVERFYYFYSIFYAFSFYFIPCVLFFVLYGKIIMTLKKRQGQGDRLGKSKVIDRAASQLTKSAVVVTVIFIVTIGPDSWLYMLGSLGAAEYEYNSPLQKIMVFFTLLNSCANPIVYLFLLPAYRHDVLKLLSWSNGDKEEDRPPSRATETGSLPSVATVGT